MENTWIHAADALPDWMGGGQPAINGKWSCQTTMSNERGAHEKRSSSAGRNGTCNCGSIAVRNTTDGGRGRERTQNSRPNSRESLRTNRMAQLASYILALSLNSSTPLFKAMRCSRLLRRALIASTFKVDFWSVTSSPLPKSHDLGAATGGVILLPKAFCEAAIAAFAISIGGKRSMCSFGWTLPSLKNRFPLMTPSAQQLAFVQFCHPLCYWPAPSASQGKNLGAWVYVIELQPPRCSAIGTFTPKSRVPDGSTLGHNASGVCLL
jgi:hypothetical protein